MKKIWFGIIILCVAIFSSMHIEMKSRQDKLSKIDSSLVDSPNRIFTDKDLLENQNFTKELERLRSTSFAGMKAKRPNETTAAVEKSKKEKAEAKKKTGKKKRTKVAKKEGEKATDEVSEEISEDMDNEAKDNETETGMQADTIYTQDMNAEDAQNSALVLQWIQLLKADPSESNLELFQQALMQGEISEANWLVVVDSLLRENTNSLNMASFYLLSKNLKLSHYQRLAILLSKTKNSKIKAKIEAHLDLDYRSQIQGLLVLKQAIHPNLESVVRLQALKTLMLAFSEYNPSVESSADRTRDSQAQIVGLDFKNFYMELSFYINTNLEELSDSSSIASYVYELGRNLNNTFPVSNSGDGIRGGLRI